MTDPEELEPKDHVTPDERDIEAPADDAVEQATVVDPDYDEPTKSDSVEAPEWDALEQSMVVQLEDDYR
jgi:hypothetical protein